MTFNEAMTRIRAAGWGGVSVWQIGTAERGNVMGCLLKPDGMPDHDTNLWDYEETPEKALLLLVRTAEEHGIS